MKFKTCAVFQLLLLGMVLAVAPNNDPQRALSLIKNASEEGAIIKALSSLGLSDSIIKAYSNYGSSEIKRGTIFSRKSLIRTDTFKRKLSPDSDSACVSQVIFQTGSETENTLVRIYFIFVNEGSEKAFRPIWQHVFESPFCAMLNAGKTILRFNNIKGKEYSVLLFQRAVVESCGMELSAYDQVDTLDIQGEKYELKEGIKFNSKYTNLRNIPE